ncbi:MAG: PEGA domain-containing protein [Calditrichaeota bacterium]|nr:PEGA domain-containing protein [Calditrichota bacterium]
MLLVAWVVGLGSYLLIDRFWPGQTGAVMVVSSPPGAEIWMDLAPTGRATPADLREVPVGKHSFTVRLEGKRPQPFVQVVKVARDTRDSLIFIFDGDSSALTQKPDIPSATPPATVPPKVESIEERVKRELPNEVERRVPSSVDNSVLTGAEERKRPEPKLDAIEELREELGLPEPKVAERKTSEDKTPETKSPEATPAREIPKSTESVRTESETGSVEISSSVNGAQIVINDQQVPYKTPAVVSLPLGTHRISVEYPGYKSDPEEQVVRLSRIAGAQLVYFTLTEEQRARKEMTITTEPVQGAIFVDGDSVGNGLAVVAHDFGVYEISFGPVEGFLTPEPQRVVVTPAKPNPAITVKYARAFHVSAACINGGTVTTEGDIQWEIGIYDRDKGARASDTHGPKISKIPSSDKSGWELAMGDPNRNPTGADYIEFTFDLPDEVPPSTPLNLRLYIYRSNRKYPLSLSSRCEVTVTVNGRVFLDNFRPRHEQTDADSERYEEWSLQHSLVPGENRIMIRTGDKNQIFNYLWKFEVL